MIYVYGIQRQLFFFKYLQEVLFIGRNLCVLNFAEQLLLERKQHSGTDRKY